MRHSSVDLCPRNCGRARALYDGRYGMVEEDGREGREGEVNFILDPILVSNPVHKYWTGNNWYRSFSLQNPSFAASSSTIGRAVCDGRLNQGCVCCGGGKTG